jgi:hypothetical protein
VKPKIEWEDIQPEIYFERIRQHEREHFNIKSYKRYLRKKRIKKFLHFDFSENKRESA